MAEKKFFISVEELQSAYAEEGSTIKVANKFGVSKKLILNYLKRFGIIRNPPNDASNVVEQIKDLAGKHTSKEISAILDLSLSTVNKHLRKNDIQVTRYHKGFTQTWNGYILLYKPNHCMANIKGYVREHIYNMSNLLDRKLLEDEVVHHKDENKSNNDLSNLQIMTKYEHKLLHSKQPRKKV